MDEKPEALRLADVPVCERSITWQSDATIELRRLHEANGELLKALNAMLSHTANLDPMQGYRPEEDFSAVKQARAAIAKAEGQQ
jgi:hypothetical protein